MNRIKLMEPNIANKETDLNNQNIVLSSTSDNPNIQAIPNTGNFKYNLPPYQQEEATNNQPTSGGFIEEQKQKIGGSIYEAATNKLTSGCFKCLNVVEILKPYFKISNDDVFERIKASLIPMNNTFFENASKNPDLYGPFWIATTLIFLIALVGTINNYYSV